MCVVEAIQGDLVKRARQGEAELSRVGQVKNYESLLIKSQEEIEENIGAGFEYHK